MYILLAGISHKTAPVELREKMALQGKSLKEAYDELKQSKVLEGMVILSTCNRTEVYATARVLERGVQELKGFFFRRLGLPQEELDKTLYTPNCEEAVLHLFRVAAGLESMVIGETQVLGQVKDAYLMAVEEGASDAVLNTLFQKAIYVGKKARTDTGLDRHAVSVSYAAVELAKQVFGSLTGRTVLVVGAGEMSELAVEYLKANGVSSVVVSNRSYERARCLAERFGGEVLPFDRLGAYLNHADIVISCTAANHYVLKTEDIKEWIATREIPLLLIDIAVPRDIEPEVKSLPGVYLYDIDDLRNIVDANLLERMKAAKQAEAIVREQLEEFNDWLGTLYVIPVIKALRQRGEDVKEREIKRALNRLGDYSPRQEKIIRSLASSIVNQLLHFPVIKLKEMAVDSQGHVYAEVIKNLFQLNVELEENQDYGYSKDWVQRE